MSEPFLAQISIMSFNFAPRGWAFCDGQMLPISQNQSLYSLLGTTYGGDGRTTFALPDLRGCSPMHKNNEHRLGQKSGSETVTLSTAQIAAHSHSLKASSVEANNRNIADNILSKATPDTDQLYASPSSNNTTLRSDSITASGGEQAHNNMQPFLTLSYCIALQGLFPSRN